VAAEPETSEVGRDEKLVRNQAVFREVNERISDLSSGFASAYHQMLDLFCECSDASCTVRIRVTVEEYEHVRACADRFLVYPRHDSPQIERVVDCGRGYEVVEMFGDAAGLVADLDPRTRLSKEGRSVAHDSASPATRLSVKPRLLFFHSLRSGPSRRAEAYLAQVLQRGHNHNTFQVSRIGLEEHPDIVKHFRVQTVPALLLVEGNVVRARLETLRGAKEIEQFLLPWLTASQARRRSRSLPA
jgi:hypothetical protein